MTAQFPVFVLVPAFEIGITGGTFDVQFHFSSLSAPLTRTLDTVLDPLNVPSTRVLRPLNLRGDCYKRLVSGNHIPLFPRFVTHLELQQNFYQAVTDYQMGSSGRTVSLHPKPTKPYA